MSNRVEQDEFNNALSEGNIHAYYADSELDICGMDIPSYHKTSNTNKTGGLNIGKAFGAFSDYTKMYEDLEDKVESDGEVQNAKKRATELAENDTLFRTGSKNAY